MEREKVISIERFLSQHMCKFRNEIDVRIKCISNIGERSSYACLLKCAREDNMSIS